MTCLLAGAAWILIFPASLLIHEIIHTEPKESP